VRPKCRCKDNTKTDLNEILICDGVDLTSFLSSYMQQLFRCLADNSAVSVKSGPHLFI
jgi:hypothetical protein